MRKKYLKKRILVNIFVVLICAMAISTIAGYVYFERVVRNQKISDERVKLQHLSSQIEFIKEDIENFARSIIVDDQIRESIEQREYDTELARLKNIDTVMKRLIFYNSLRTNIGSSFIELNDGRRYSSGNSSMGEDYIRRKFESEEFKLFSQQLNQVFSSPYYGVDTGNMQKVVCYSSKILDIHNFGKQQGTLYLEIYLEYFLKQMRMFGDQYENLCLLGNEQNILYEQGEKGKIPQYLNTIDVDDTSGVHKVTGGYLINENIEAVGWNLYVMIPNSYLWERSQFVLYFFVISFMISLSLILILTSRILQNMIQPITRLSEQMEQIDYYKLDMGEMVDTQDEIQTLYECYDKMLKDIQRSIQERLEHEQQKREMEFDIMLSQINPHYLYNVLNTVVYLAAAEKNGKVVKIVNSLIYSLQETLNIGEYNIYTTIEKELEFTKCYLDIQRYRYFDTFEVNIFCNEEVKCCVVPKTIIQPLVENAILHGILPAERKGMIEITIIKTEHTIEIKISDDGIGISEKQLESLRSKKDVVYEKNVRKHIGISNVRDRIIYLYGKDYGVNIESSAGRGTIVTLRIPVKDIKNENII